MYDYCIPSNECTLAGGDCSCEDPCKVFDAVEFPMDDFFPPAAAPGGCGCACPCGEQKKSNAKKRGSSPFLLLPVTGQTGISGSTAS